MYYTFRHFNSSGYVNSFVIKIDYKEDKNKFKEQLDTAFDSYMKKNKDWYFDKMFKDVFNSFNVTYQIVMGM